MDNCTDLSGAFELPNCSEMRNNNGAQTFEFMAIAMTGAIIVVYFPVFCLVFGLRLHKLLVYRMNLYQVLSSMAFGVAWIIYVSLSIYMSFSMRNSRPTAYAYLIFLSSVVANVIMNTWIVIHLWALAVFYKSLNRLEPLYVATSTIVPLIFAIVALSSSSTRNLNSGAAAIALLFMALVIYFLMFITCFAVVVLAITLCYRAYKRNAVQVSKIDVQHKKALFEMLPLLVYPVGFFLISLPSFICEVTLQYDKITQNCSCNYVVICAIATLVVPLCSLMAPLSLFVHVCVVLHIKKKRMKSSSRSSEQMVTVRDDGPWTTSGQCTYYSLPVED